jgi:hypothetical protein
MRPKTTVDGIDYHWSREKGSRKCGNLQGRKREGGGASPSALASLVHARMFSNPGVEATGQKPTHMNGFYTHLWQKLKSKHVQIDPSRVSDIANVKEALSHEL